MSDDEAIEYYRRTGRHLGIFSSPAEATAYAQRLHDDQAAEYGGVPDAAQMRDLYLRQFGPRGEQMYQEWLRNSRHGGR